ncbi:MAG TPA: RNA polymerase factor sigma-54 [Planctomycetota bacterium]|nr:RNA polymerase factor sigma-54 [Planctomycetota bacterium]
MSSMQQSMSLSQSMQLKLQMTTQMIQSIELLQLPLLALQERVEQELEVNPALEQEEPEESADQHGPADEPGDDTAERAFEEQIHDMEEEWNESLGSSYRPRGDSEDAKYEAMQNTAAPGISLRDFLDEQLTLTEAAPRLKELARLIIYNLDDSGLLTLPLEEVFSPGALKPAEPEEDAAGDPDADDGAETGEGRGAVVPPATEQAPPPPPLPEPPSQPAGEPPTPPIDPPPTPEEAETALAMVQNLDPPGVGARSIQETILIQLRRSPGDTSFEERIVAEHFQDLVQNRLPKIAKDLGADIDRIKEAIEVIAEMNPKPGALFGGTAAHYVRPDVIVEPVGDEYQVRLSDWGLPRLRVSPTYLDMLREQRKDKQLRDYVQDKIRSARWLIEAINQRKNTLLRIAKSVVELQRDFVDKGVAHLKPLPMQEVADRLGLHVSTISRAMTDKYIQTPHGVFPLRYFIVGGYQTADGDGESARAVMERIREMVGKEDPAEPLTDQQIVSSLRASGLDVARRTVAKYREKLGIAGSRQRRKY